MTPGDVKHVKTESYYRWEQSNKPSAYIKQSLQHEVDAFFGARRQDYSSAVYGSLRSA